MSSLYLNHFALSSPPFSITPDLGFFFEGKERGTFATGLLYATLQAEGIVLIIGEVGSGKTLMSRLLLDRLPKNVDTVYLPNPAFFPNEIIEVICRDLGLNGVSSNEGTRLEILQRELIKRHEMGREVVVVIDEAHTMPAESIEEVRRLSNLETGKHKLVQIVLFGQPELDVLLEMPHLRQVRDRVVYRLTLSNLSKDDARAYLDYRLRVAGWRGGRIFSKYAERLLLADAMGRTRRLNLLADKALLAAYVDNAKQVKARHVRRAIKDAGANFATVHNTNSGRWVAVAAMAVFAILGAGTAFQFISQQDHTQTIAAVSTPQGASPSGRSVVADLPAATSTPTAESAIPPAGPLPEKNAGPAIVQQVATSSSNGNNAPQSVSPEHTQPTKVSSTPPVASPDPTASSQSETAILAATSTQPAAGYRHLRPAAASQLIENTNDYIVIPSPEQQDENSVENQPAAGVLPAQLNRRIQEDYKYAQQEAASGNYGIQLATISVVDDITSYITEAEKIFSPGHIHLRRAPNGQQSRYVIYLGSFATYDAARLAVANLPDRLLKDNPFIRSWKEIYDVPWKL